MAPAERGATARIGRSSILLYTFAYVGAFLTFIPFFSILLPMKVSLIAPGDGAVRLMSEIATSGALVASGANIAFGALSDRTWVRSGTRRPWIVAGLALVIGAYALIHMSGTRESLILSVILLQVAINMLLAPLVAVMADEVPDAQKGSVAALLGTAHPLASLAGALLVTPIFADDWQRYLTLCFLVAMAILPFCIQFREAGGAEASVRESPVAAPPSSYLLVWLARLLVQTAGMAVSTYIFLFWMNADAALGPPPFEARARSFIATTIAVGTVIAVTLTLVAGRLSDVSGRRKPFLAAAALAMTVALPVLAAQSSWALAVAAYFLFMSGYATFIALHSAFAMETLPSPAHRGRDLGFLNLTNTIPSMVVPLIILTNGTTLASIFTALAGATALGGLLMIAARRGPAQLLDRNTPAPISAQDRHRGPFV